MRKYLTTEQVNRLGVEIKSNNYLHTVALHKKLLEFTPCQVLHIVSEYEERLSYEYSEIHTTGFEITVKIDYSEHLKKFTLYCVELGNLKNITHYTVREIKAKLKQPNQIGVMTLKKLMQWVDFYSAVYKEAKVINDNNLAMIADFRKQIENYSVRYYDEDKKTRGRITKNGVVFVFHIQETYVGMDIELERKNCSLEYFEKLSNNQLNKSITI
jgi:hypothetical protein